MASGVERGSRRYVVESRGGGFREPDSAINWDDFLDSWIALDVLDDGTSHARLDI